MKSPKRSMEQNSTKTSKAAANGNQENGNGSAEAAASSMDAVALIKNDHRKVEALFEQFESASAEDKKAEIAKQVCTELIIHAMIEEELFYPACREAEVKDEMLDEAQVEHDGVKVLIREIMAESPDEEFYDAKVKVLSEYVKHHVAEEEEPENGILAKAQAADVDMDALGKKLQARKSELMRKAESRGLGMPVPKTLHNQPRRQGGTQEYGRMDRNTYAERDERGRFVSDDDDDRRRYSRSDRDDDDRRYSRPRDERGRFESDDDRRSSRGRDDDDDRRSSGGGRGWYGDPEGHSQAARRRRRDDDD